MIKDAFKFAAWSALAAIVWATVSPIGWRPPNILLTNVDRALAFALMCGLFVLAYPHRWRWALLAAIFAPGAIELLQVFSPTRHARVDDAIIKTIGGLDGVFIAAIVRLQIWEFAVKWRAGLRVRHLTPRFIEASMVALPVKSRMIKSVHFSHLDGRLRIGFSDGQERVFEGVSETDAMAIVASPSPGTYYINDFRKRFKRAA